MIPRMPIVISSELTTGWVRKRTSVSAHVGDAAAHLGAGEVQGRQHRVEGVGADVREPVLQGLLRS